MLRNVTLLLFSLLLSACVGSSDSTSDSDNKGSGIPIEETDPSAPDDDSDPDDDSPTGGGDDTDPPLVWNQGAFNKTFWQ